MKTIFPENPARRFARTFVDVGDCQRAVEITLGQLDKQLGQGSALRWGPHNMVAAGVIPTGCLSVDAALGVGGFPRGRVSEVFGHESSGKTTLALQALAEAQRAGGTAAFIDAEHALDPVYAQALGVDTDSLLVSRPDCGEQALEITAALVNSRAVDAIVIDSVAALVPEAELEAGMGDSDAGLHTRLMSQALRKLAGAAARTNTCLIFINQVRERVGATFGNPETTTGGRALKFYASVRVDVRRVAAIRNGDRVVGSRTRVRIVKNKVAAPFREADFDLIHGEGVSREGDLIDLGVLHGIVGKSDEWLSYRGERIGEGRDAARRFLKERGDVGGLLEAELRRILALPARSPEARKPGAAAS